MQDNTNLIESVIRDEVRNILSARQVPEEDLPVGDEVPINDLTSKQQEDIGIYSTSGLADNITPSMTSAGTAVEPNEALEGSVLDPLSNTLLGGVAIGIGKIPGAYGTRVTKQTGEYLKKNANIDPAEGGTLGQNVIGAVNKAKEGSSSAAATLFKGSKIPALEKVGSAINTVTDPVAALLSEGAATRLFQKASKPLSTAVRSGDRLDSLSKLQVAAITGMVRGGVDNPEVIADALNIPVDIVTDYLTIASTLPRATAGALFGLDE